MSTIHTRYVGRGPWPLLATLGEPAVLWLRTMKPCDLRFVANLIHEAADLAEAEAAEARLDYEHAKIMKQKGATS